MIVLITESPRASLALKAKFFRCGSTGAITDLSILANAREVNAGKAVVANLMLS